jgi:hypothetical protein
MVALGPAIGFVMGSVFVSEWINIGDDKNVDGITKSDPRWIGRWWAGFIVSSAFLILFSLFLSTFPSRLRENNDEINQSDSNIDQQSEQVRSSCHLSNIKGSFYAIFSFLSFN